MRPVACVTLDVYAYVLKERLKEKQRGVLVSGAPGAGKSTFVKVPTGMRDEDLARPVIEVQEFDSKKLMFEIYSFGEQVVVMPMAEIVTEKPTWRLAARTLEYELGKLVKGSLVVEVKSDHKATIYLLYRRRPDRVSSRARGQPHQ